MRPCGEVLASRQSDGVKAPTIQDAIALACGRANSYSRALALAVRTRIVMSVSAD